MTEGKLLGTCAVCLRVMQLRGDRPIRHGFSAIGVRHGESGGYHTGPCAGTRFSHLGISTEGTRWALDHERAHLDLLRASLATLATNPDITWYPKKYDVRGGRADLSKPVVVRHGAERDYATGAPSYDQLRRSEVAKLEGHVAMADRAIAAYEDVLATWSPEKYPTSPAPAKVEIAHMATPRRNSRGDTWTGIRCRYTKPGYASDLPVKTPIAADVTCRRCRAATEPPKED